MNFSLNLGDKTSLQILNRFRALLLARNAKTFKRDLKLAAGLRGNHVSAFEFMRSNVEYLKGNHRKAMKMLATALSNSKSAPTPLVAALFQNNLGVSHVMMRKPHTALFHLGQAAKNHAQALKEDNQMKER